MTLSVSTFSLVTRTFPIPSSSKAYPALTAAYRRHSDVSGDPPRPPPTAPWATPSLPPNTPAEKPPDENPKHDSHLTAKVRGGRSRYAMRRIVRSVEKLQEINAEAKEGEGVGDRWAGEEPRIRVPWERTGRVAVFRREKREREVTEAERVLERALLERLREEARGMKLWIRAKRRGVTEEVVEEIKKVWKGKELAMVKVVEPLSRNMDRAREIVEMKTGGLVVWTKKDKLVIYRGSNFQTTSKEVCGPHLEECHTSLSEAFTGNTGDMNSSISGFGSNLLLERDHQLQTSCMFIENMEPVRRSLFERETDRLLNGLGPRFIDWWMRKPLPVDGDLLPEFVPHFKPPFRNCLPHVQTHLTDDELTYLRKLARPLPTHFVLGKNTKLQGLAAAIIKLWERSLIAKIAVKRGILNTDDKIMSSELKHLTGGTLILRNKFYIILYRGKDFIPETAANLIIEREVQLRNLQAEEEQARKRAVDLFHASQDVSCGNSVVGTFMESLYLQATHSFPQSRTLEMKVKLEAEKAHLDKELRKQKHQLSIIRLKLERSNEVLARLNFTQKPSAHDVDEEFLTMEERQKFQKIGLKMDEVLLLGRRGIYDGVIGNMHLHWRHRELVKVVTMQKEFSQVIHTAQLLELESGGILIEIEKYKSGHGIIIFRGKNYRPPLKLLPQNLLTKKEALQRSIEVQRRGSLKFFARQREASILALENRIKSLMERDLLLECWELGDDH